MGGKEKAPPLTLPPPPSISAQLYPTSLPQNLPPPPLSVSVPATGLPLNVFTFSSFDCSQSALFYSTRESEIPGFSPSQAELNTAPAGHGDGGCGGGREQGGRGGCQEGDSNTRDPKCNVANYCVQEGRYHKLGLTKLAQNESATLMGKTMNQEGPDSNNVSLGEVSSEPQEYHQPFDMLL